MTDGIEAVAASVSADLVRRFGLEDNQLQRIDRMDSLILITELAVYWAVSTGM